jgi:hypothetical protein
MLPSGKRFARWEPVLKFTHTYHVDCAHPAASDRNPGTLKRPFKTIGRAAEALRPGERVVVAAGIYRERVVPLRGGTSPERMISYQAAPGATVIVRGSEPAAGPWREDGGAGSVFALPLDAFFEGVADEENPFARPNLADSQLGFMGWAKPQRGRLPFRLPCGLVFWAGRRLLQVPNRAILKATPGTYWVDARRRELLVHLACGTDPAKAGIEITTRQQLFAPREPGLRYVHVRGFVFEHAGNPFPMPQYGAISTTRGSWWTIEDNVVRQVNGVGIDIARQLPTLPQPRIRPQGTIVRRNIITDCGISGLQGLGTTACLIEGNLFVDNAFHDAERMFESAAAKTHMTRDTLIRDNVVLRTAHGSGIWIDADCRNSRISGNVVVDTATDFGGIFVEISDQPNLVDHNVVWSTRGAGIYEHDTERQLFCDNRVGEASGPAMWLRGSLTGRHLPNRLLRGGRHVVIGNLLVGSGSGIVTKDPQRSMAGNVEVDGWMQR